MTVKFFPLFFKDDVGLSPIKLQIIYVIVPLAMVFFAHIFTKLAKVLGRVQTIILTRILGLGALFSMVFCEDYLLSNAPLLILIYIFRTGVMNATYPLDESLLMDFVPKDERARWKSLSSVAVCGWCGSAWIGGILADKYDYSFTFLITAILQGIGSVGYLWLLPLVPIDEKQGAKGKTTEEKDSLYEPLLGSDNNDSVLQIVV